MILTPSVEESLMVTPKSWVTKTRFVGFARTWLLVIGIRPARKGIQQAGSAHRIDADQVARGIPDRAVANPVGLLGRFLHDLGATGFQPGEGVVEVSGGQRDDAVRSLGHHLGDGATFVV